MPSSSACWKNGSASSCGSVHGWNPLAGSPKLMQPRAMRLTRRPEPPSRAYFMVSSSRRGCGSGLGDGPAEALEGHDLGLRSTAPAGLEPVDRSDLVGRELEVDDVEVLRDPLRLGGLRDHRAALLDAPTQQHLRGRLAARLGDAGDDGILQGAGVLALAVEGDAADGGPGLVEDAVLAVEVLHLALLEVGVDLELVDPGHDVGAVEQTGEVVDHEVA